MGHYGTELKFILYQELYIEQLNTKSFENDER